jgi:hypothetical protein
MTEEEKKDAPELDRIKSENEALRKEVGRLSRENQKMKTELDALRVMSPKNRLPEGYTDSNKDVMFDAYDIIDEPMRINPKDDSVIPAKKRRVEAKIDDEIAKILRRDEVYAGYHSQVFHGFVWWDREAKTFKCEIWEGPIYRRTLTGTLQEIMKQAHEE